MISLNLPFNLHAYLDGGLQIGRYPCPPDDPLPMWADSVVLSSLYLFFRSLLTGLVLLGVFNDQVDGDGGGWNRTANGNQLLVHYDIIYNFLNQFQINLLVQIDFVVLVIFFLLVRVIHLRSMNKGNDEFSRLVRFWHVELISACHNFQRDDPDQSLQEWLSQANGSTKKLYSDFNRKWSWMRFFFGPQKFKTYKIVEFCEEVRLEEFPRWTPIVKTRIVALYYCSELFYTCLTLMLNYFFLIPMFAPAFYGVYSKVLDDPRILPYQWLHWLALLMLALEYVLVAYVIHKWFHEAVFETVIGPVIQTLILFEHDGQNEWFRRVARNSGKRSRTFVQTQRLCRDLYFFRRQIWNVIHMGLKLSSSCIASKLTVYVVFNVPASIFMVTMVLVHWSVSFMDCVGIVGAFYELVFLIHLCVNMAKGTEFIHQSRQCYVAVQARLEGRWMIKTKLMLMRMHEIINSKRLFTFKFAQHVKVNKKFVFKFALFYLTYVLTVAKFLRKVQF